MQDKRVGLVGFHTNTGLGELNKQIVTFCDIDTWLIKPHSRYPTLPLSTDTLAETRICPSGLKLKEFLSDIDVVLFCETPLYHNLTEFAVSMDKRVVCVPMHEWTPFDGWIKNVDLFICPNSYCYGQLKDKMPCTQFDWPIDTSRFKWRLRNKAQRFLFINGHGGWKDRKGERTMRTALEYWPEMPLTVITQVEPKLKWPSNVEVITNVYENVTLYDHGDVLVCPHSVDGIGLEILEAASCGMPCISTCGPPWIEYPALARINSKVAKNTTSRPVDWYVPNPRELAMACKAVLNTDIEEQSYGVRKWAEKKDWELHAELFTELVIRGLPDA